ncbi:hypothetical protein C6Q17_21785 [Burkholderia contaminans]|nr:hypothetical protein C6Q17_21785 [Burkholderia contaminans]
MPRLRSVDAYCQIGAMYGFTLAKTPIPNHPYTVTSADGQTIQGTTDASGHTDWISSHQAASLSFHQPGSNA